MKSEIQMKIEQFFRAVVLQDRANLPGYFMPEAKVYWPCTNECFTVEEFIRANCEYPGSWDGEIERFEQLGEGYLLIGRVFAKDQSSSHHVVSLIQMQADRIARLEEYWGEDSAAPDWRLQMQVGCPIHGRE